MPRTSRAEVTHLICVVVTDDAFVFRKSQFTALICRKGKRGQKARSQGMFWSIIIGNWNRTGTFLLLYPVIASQILVFLSAKSRSVYM